MKTPEKSITSMVDASFMAREIRGAVFDLDGVLVDTAKYHFQAWRAIACQLGFDLPEQVNEWLKGVSRQKSLEIVLQYGHVTCDESLKQQLTKQKNDWYVQLLNQLDTTAILPGVKEYLRWLKTRKVRIALGSASSNARMILEKTGLVGHFDAIVDGTYQLPAKPEPDVFQMAASQLAFAPDQCVVFEDSIAGITAAKSAGMLSVGIGNPTELANADIIIRSLDVLLPKSLREVS